jgi:hypothetical protein
VPEFDEEGMRLRLSSRSHEDLVEMLLRAYKQTRVYAKMADELSLKVARIVDIAQEPSTLLNMPGIPGDDDLRKMME